MEGEKEGELEENGTVFDHDGCLVVVRVRHPVGDNRRLQSNKRTPRSQRRRHFGTVMKRKRRGRERGRHFREERKARGGEWKCSGVLLILQGEGTQAIQMTKKPVHEKRERVKHHRREIFTTKPK